MGLAPAQIFLHFLVVQVFKKMASWVDGYGLVDPTCRNL